MGKSKKFQGYKVKGYKEHTQQKQRTITHELQYQNASYFFGEHKTKASKPVTSIFESNIQNFDIQNISTDPLLTTQQLQHSIIFSFLTLLQAKHQRLQKSDHAKNEAVFFIMLIMFGNLSRAFAANVIAENATQTSVESEIITDHHEGSLVFAQTGAVPKIDATTPFADLPNGPSYKGLETKILDTTKIHCVNKVKGGCLGKVCKLGDKTLYMKEVAAEGEELIEEQLTRMGREGGRVFPPRTIHNMQLVKSIPNKSIVVPHCGIFHIKKMGTAVDNTDGSQIYLGCEAVPDFVPAKTILNELRGNRDKSQIAISLQERIGDIKNLATVFVMTTICGDLAMTWDNWGYAANYEAKPQVIVVDVDHLLETVADYFQNARDSIKYLANAHHLHLTYPLVQLMVEYYSTMRTQPVPNILESVNLSQDMYEYLLDAYIKVCNDILSNYFTMKDSDLGRKLSDAFVEGISNVLREAKENLNVHPAKFRRNN